MIKETLELLGFGQKEIEVYLAILKQGKTTPARIARMTGINRSTVYSVAKELLEKKVISEDLAGTIRYLVALPPQDFKKLIQADERKLDKKRELVVSAIKELEAFAPKVQYSAPKIVFIFESDIEEYLYRETPKWNKSIMEYDKIWWGFQDDTFVKNYEAWINWYWKASPPKDLKIRIISNDSDIEGKMKEKPYPQRDIRFWKKAKDFTATTWVAGDYIVMLVTNAHPYYVMEINDKVLANNLRKIFQGLWEELYES